MLNLMYKQLAPNPRNDKYFTHNPYNCITFCKPLYQVILIRRDLMTLSLINEFNFFQLWYIYHARISISLVMNDYRSRYLQLRFLFTDLSSRTLYLQVPIP